MLHERTACLCGLQQAAQAVLHALRYQLKPVGAPAAAVFRKQPTKQLLLRGGDDQQQQQRCVCSRKTDTIKNTLGDSIMCNRTMANHERGQPAMLLAHLLACDALFNNLHHHITPNSSRSKPPTHLLASEAIPKCLPQCIITAAAAAGATLAQV